MARIPATSSVAPIAGRRARGRSGSSGAGRLDVDVVPPAHAAVGPHVERIVWPTAAPGEYAPWAQFQSVGWGHEDGAGFVLTARRGGQIVATITGPIGEAGERSRAVLAAIA